MGRSVIFLIIFEHGNVVHRCDLIVPWDVMQPRVDVKMGDAAEIKESKRMFIVPTIKSVDHYDFTRAKISCSLTWLIAKAFGSGRWRLKV